MFLGSRSSEIFPRMAKIADKYALVRSLYHTAAAVHDTGHQMMQTGTLVPGRRRSHRTLAASWLARKGPQGRVPPHVLLPDRSATLGVACLMARKLDSWARLLIRLC